MKTLKLGLALVSILLINDAVAMAADDLMMNFGTDSCTNKSFNDVSVKLDNSLYFYIVNQANSTCQSMSDPGVSNLKSALVHYGITKTGSVAYVKVDVSGTCMSKKNVVEGDAFKATYSLPESSGVVANLATQMGLQGNNYCGTKWPGSVGSFRLTAGGPSTNVLREVKGSVTCQICKMNQAWHRVDQNPL